jgi:poly(hydroxyalkanoate) depolymerase family esterase
MGYYTWRRGARACAVLLAAAAALLAVLTHATSAAGAHKRSARTHRETGRRHGRRAHPRATRQRSLSTRSYTNAAGRLSYELYVPKSYKPGTAVPLVVALHGCTQTADVFRRLTRFDTLAATKRFIVVLPEQSTSRNSLRCWNWFQAQDMHRGSGEPSLIAGITGWVRRHYTVDRRRIYVAGLSAGGAMAEVMGATYPELYGAVGVGSGCEYDAGVACAGYRSADPVQAGRAAYQEMGRHARPVPFAVFQGDQDYIVPPSNAQQLVRAGQVAADWADDGSDNGSVPTAPTKSTSGQSPGGQSYTTSYYSDGHGRELAQLWLVHGMGHAWSGGNAAEQYADPAGPGETAAMYDFFTNHPAP